MELFRSSPPPAVIFVTAHDEYAVKAFVANAEHYLLKPIDDDQFEEALERARRTLSRHRHTQEETPRSGNDYTIRPALSSQVYLDRITVKDGEQYRMSKTTAIDWVESCGNYIRLRTKGQSFTVRMVLKEIEEKLNPAQFGNFEILLTDRACVRLSRRYRARVLPAQA